MAWQTGMRCPPRFLLEGDFCGRVYLLHYSAAQRRYFRTSRPGPCIDELPPAPGSRDSHRVRMKRCIRERTTKPWRTPQKTPRSVQWKMCQSPRLSNMVRAEAALYRLTLGSSRTPPAEDTLCARPRCNSIPAMFTDPLYSRAEQPTRLHLGVHHARLLPVMRQVRTVNQGLAI